jgi:NADH dehydrogenase FAD-containing subunit
MPTPHVTILGVGYAGQMAAARIAKRRPDVRLTVIDASLTFVVNPEKLRHLPSLQ